MGRGLFITLEGGEGVGKSTQLGRLAERLRAAGRTVVATREPGGSPRAERLRDLLLSGELKAQGPVAETLVFAAARADHLRTAVAPALAAGAIVLCDRFTDSTRVYQGALAGVDARLLATLERVVLDGLSPDLTLILDLPAGVGMARADARRAARGERPDRFELEGLGYHERVREAFLDIARREPRRVRVVDAARAPEHVAADLWEAVAALLPAIAGR